MKKQTFSIRTLLHLTLLVACFFAGYRLGVRNRPDDSVDKVVGLVLSTINPDQWMSSGTIYFTPEHSSVLLSDDAIVSPSLDEEDPFAE